MAKYPSTREFWTAAFVKEWGNLACGDHKTGTKVTRSLLVLDHKEIKRIPADCTVTYAKMVVDYRPQKEDPNRVRITAGGNLMN